MNEAQQRAIQANEIAGIVIDVMAQVHPDLFADITLRYGIADAVWAAGYRKVEEER